MKKYFFVCITILAFTSCKEKEVTFSANVCKKNPAFIQSMGFNPAYSFFSTSDERTMGLVLQQSNQPGNPNAKIIKSSQHPSWRQAGWLAPILIDQNGNIFTAPAPFISVLDNPLNNQNTIYKVDARTGLMDLFMKLPLTDSTTEQNPFGIIGMVLLCEANILYVSTLSGSDRIHERGVIYAVSLETKKIIDKLTATDAMGMGISYITGKRTLFFGTGRSSDVFSISLTAGGKFSGTPQKLMSLSGLGPRGDDKIRRIRTDQTGNLIIYGMEFNYNLIPQREKKETLYFFYYDMESKTWLLRK
jgi:hypothetical protein